MSHIIKDGRPVGIGRNVRVTVIPSDLREKRKALTEDTGYIEPLGTITSRDLLMKAKSDPVTFTYALWRMFKEDAEYATEKICDIAVTGDPRHVLKALEIMLFDASKQINALCLTFIISQLAAYIDTNPMKVKRTIKKMLLADFLATLKIMKGMYDASPKVTKEIAKKIMSATQYKIVKNFIRPKK